MAANLKRGFVRNFGVPRPSSEGGSAWRIGRLFLACTTVNQEQLDAAARQGPDGGGWVTANSGGRKELAILSSRPGFAYWISPRLRVSRIIERIAARLPFARRALRRREQRRMVREIRQSGLFDTGFYFANNPDVAASGSDLALHFATNGWKEGRKPSPGFDPQFYLSEYPDVAASGMNPLLHYVRSGREEGRQTLPGFYGGALTAPRDIKTLGSTAVTSVASILRTHNAAWAPLPIFADHRSDPTVTILTDGVDPEFSVRRRCDRHGGGRLRRPPPGSKAASRNS